MNKFKYEYIPNSDYKYFLLNDLYFSFITNSFKQNPDIDTHVHLIIEILTYE